MIVHAIQQHGPISINGGGGGSDGTCESGVLMGGPPYMDFDDSHIWGPVTIQNVQSCWQGFIRNTVRGPVTIKNNTFEDPDANEIVTNTIWGPLNCSGNTPAAEVGDPEGVPNVVHGPKIGECTTV